MPHFIIDCSEDIINHTPQETLEAVYSAAESSGLFAKGDIKVRLRPYHYFKLGEGKDSFIHVFANIMQGRTDEQKKNLSTIIVKTLKEKFSHVPIISMNVRDFEAASYINREMV